MKLKAKQIGYSSIVGGGLLLVDEAGAGQLIVNFMGTTKGISKEQYLALSEQIGKLINQAGLDVPEHPR